MENFSIDSIDYDGIQENFVGFLKTQGFYNDYNFSGSGVSSLINILSYNAHFIAYYVKMMLNESFLDSATLRESLTSKAKLNGYLPKGYRSSRTSVIIRVNMQTSQEPSTKTVVINKGSVCIGANTDFDNRKYYILEDVVCYNRVESDTGLMVSYYSPDITVYEGNYSFWKFKRDYDVFNQRFIIQDNKIDIDTLRVYVFPSDDSEISYEYKLASSIFDIDPTSSVFYLSTNETSNYEIFFGNNKFGKDVENGSRIEISYVTTDGPPGDGCNSMTFSSEGETFSGRSYIVSPSTSTQGGALPETISDLRFNIPNHYRRQNRLVTEGDYRSLLMNEFRNIDSLSIWGGEKNILKDYNSVYLSIKPNNALKLSNFSKKEIIQFLEKYQIIGKRINIIDAEYIFIDLMVYVSYNSKLSSRTKSDLENLLKTRISTYNTNILNRFENMFSNVHFLDFLKDGLPEIISIYCDKMMWKEYKFMADSSAENIIPFGNPLRKGTLTSSVFNYGASKCVLKDGFDESSIFVVNSADNTVKEFDSPIGTIDYSTGEIHVYLNGQIDTPEKLNELNIINLYGESTVPDLITNLNNILHINTSKIYLSEK
jgi:hypothetical protein